MKILKIVGFAILSVIQFIVAKGVSQKGLARRSVFLFCLSAIWWVAFFTMPENTSGSPVLSFLEGVSLSAATVLLILSLEMFFRIPEWNLHSPECSDADGTDDYEETDDEINYETDRGSRKAKLNKSRKSHYDPNSPFCQDPSELSYYTKSPCHTGIKINGDC